MEYHNEHALQNMQHEEFLISGASNHNKHIHHFSFRASSICVWKLTIFLRTRWQHATKSDCCCISIWPEMEHAKRETVYRRVLSTMDWSYMCPMPWQLRLSMQQSPANAPESTWVCRKGREGAGTIIQWAESLKWKFPFKWQYKMHFPSSIQSIHIYIYWSMYM